MAKDDDELMAAIACFTPSQMDTVLRGVHKIICNDPTIVADMKNVHQEEKMNAFLKKTVQYWGAAEDEKINEAIGTFTNFEKITLLRVLHTTVNNYLISKRITRAKQLLRFTDMTVDEIGVAVGMADANYFSRMFRKAEGISPREYRKQW